MDSFQNQGAIFLATAASSHAIKSIWGFPKIRGTFLGVPIIRIIISWGLDWGPLILANYHIPNVSRILKGGPCAPQFGKVRFRLPRRLGVFAGGRGGGIFAQTAQKDIAMFHLCSQKIDVCYQFVPRSCKE